jgi:5'(3')-deoxyribonucleotidase
MRRLVIAIDVDGVIADFVGLVRGFVSADRLPAGWEPACWDIYEDTHIKAYGSGLRRSFDVFFEMGGLANRIPPYASEVEELKSIMTRHAQRAEFVFATSPMASNRTWMHDREAWLRAQGFEDVPVIHTHRKDLVDADVLLDDKPEHVEAFVCRRSARKGVIRTRPWNAEAEIIRPFGSVVCADSMAAFGVILDDLFRLNETEHEKCEREAIGL